MYIIGCGAQAKYVFDILSILGIEIKGVFGIPINYPKKLFGYLVEEYSKKKIKQHSSVIFCIRSSRIKEILYQELKDKCSFPSIIHPKTIISKNTTIGIGNIINAGTIIQPLAKVGNFCIIHSNSIIEHDCNINNFVSLAPGVTLTGGVSIGEHTILNTCVTVVPNVAIGKNCLIGAKSLVLKNIPDNSFGFGVPIVNKDLQENHINEEHIQ